jgi:hypothetical protein
MMPEDVRTEQQLGENRRQCPEEGDGEVSPLFIPKEKEIGEYHPNADE